MYKGFFFPVLIFVNIRIFFTYLNKKISEKFWRFGKK